MKKELNVKGMISLWTRDASYVDNDVKKTIILELLTKKRAIHVVDLEEKAKMPIHIPSEKVSLNEARHFMMKGTNPLETHLKKYSVKIMIEKKKADRQKTEPMKLLSMLEPEELTEAVLACILLTTAKKKKEKMEQSNTLALSRRKSVRKEYSRKANEREKLRERGVVDFTGSQMSEDDRKEQEKYATRFGLNVYQDLGISQLGISAVNGNKSRLGVSSGRRTSMSTSQSLNKSRQSPHTTNRGISSIGGVQKGSLTTSRSNIKSQSKGSSSRLGSSGRERRYTPLPVSRGNQQRHPVAPPSLRPSTVTGRSGILPVHHI